MKYLKFFVSLKTDSRKPFLLFLFFYLIFCLVTYRQYGITWDEFNTYMSGGQWLKYYFGQPNLLFDSKPDVLFVYQSHSYFNSALIRILTLSKTIQPDRMHLTNMLLVIPIFWCFFELLRVQFKDWRWGLSGLLVLVLTPRFFGDIPANPIDVPFAVIYFICLTYIILRDKWEKNKWQQNIILGLFFGLAISLRIVAFSLFLIYFIFRVYEDGFIEKKLTWKKLVQWLLPEMGWFLVIFFVSQIILCVLWPYIGKDYFHHLLDVFKISSSFGFDKKLLFMGHSIQLLNHFLWYYLPGWVLVVTPVFILVFGFLAITKVVTLWKNRTYFLMVLALLVNFMLYLLVKPELYNGLRQYLFLIPILSFLACLGIIDFFKNTKMRFALYLAGTLIVINALLVIVQLIELYPYDYIYFNELIGGIKGAQGKFELDYWGASLREATEWLTKNEIKNPHRIYKVKLTCDQWQQVSYFLPNMTGYVNYTEKEADYWMVLNGLTDDKLPSSGTIIHTVEREGVPLSYVVKIQH